MLEREETLIGTCMVGDGDWIMVRVRCSDGYTWARYLNEMIKGKTSLTSFVDLDSMYLRSQSVSLLPPCI